MRFAVLSMVCNDRDREYAQSTWPAIRRYCSEKGFAHSLIDFPSDQPWQARFAFIQESLRHCERMIYIDPCVLIRFDCADLLRIVPSAMIGMFDEGDLNPQKKRDHGLNALYNPDVIVATCHHAQFFDSDFSKVDSGLFPIYKLPHRYNRTIQTIDATGEPLEDSYLANLRGASIERTRELSETFTRFRA